MSKDEWKILAKLIALAVAILLIGAAGLYVKALIVAAGFSTAMLP